MQESWNMKLDDFPVSLDFKERMVKARAILIKAIFTETEIFNERKWDYRQK